MIVNGWFDWMERDPGPAWKTNGGMNGGKGIVPHSAEGYRSVLRDILHGPRRASWHISVLFDRAIQHYPISAQTWTSGSGYPNNNFLGGETEGCGSVPGIAFEPWTQFQIDTWIRVGRELRQVQGWTARRPVDARDMTASCYEHNECVRFGSEYTSCPSGRNPWGTLIPAINEEEDMAAIELIWNPDFGRLYVLGQGDPRWVADPKAAADLQAAYGQPQKALSWKALQALGAK